MYVPNRVIICSCAAYQFIDYSSKLFTLLDCEMNLAFTYLTCRAGTEVLSASGSRHCRRREGFFASGFQRAGYRVPAVWVPGSHAGSFRCSSLGGAWQPAAPAWPSPAVLEQSVPVIGPCPESCFPPHRGQHTPIPFTAAPTVTPPFRQSQLHRRNLSQGGSGVSPGSLLVLWEEAGPFISYFYIHWSSLVSH